ncbi:MAG: 2-dehydropantoate 2-reductase [Deltaproteobacteria bacterium CG_4_8_14_3_um_filter_51_11]|nr:2-dehydropantoate 2-reductase [bacterium]OIP42321.1 MAG: hypothetical protein AUK25_04145 [Desulfobacteraceae bacterium CG2_30_51_40]PIP45755.1 MAG: 2-dehydropantoate 2-reductase [Deltaproteobacteria bacterium CG23_combo_of_CG06-09_8_20_14_all_51_20]PIX20015.1 MAG: 2-dehydropantoate 2-reductase [Deltaproteobacteria bacterium CG_4_8_14_3_um_filter_51_11]PIY27000.1 MAG: 2-dehydropantoate 2-reductase [Deltaproteobacteria bacterium CG_4_10_14_3_um_filter_51_14]PJB38653.1 MAG: 2-dehydropantoate 
MNILVVGPGAMGCLFAARLKDAGNNVALLDYREQRAATISRQGVIVEDGGRSTSVNVPAFAEGTAFSPEVIIVFVKSAQTNDAALNASRWALPDSIVLTLQNGLGNLETLQHIFGKERVTAGITAEGGTLLGTGHVRHAGRGETIIGLLPGKEAEIEHIATALNSAGFCARTIEKVEGLIWGKLLVNVGINALAAITRLTNGDLPETQPLRPIMRDAVEEAMEVVRAKGIQLPYDDPMEKVLEVCRATSTNIASMLQDVLRERKTEVDAINGAIVREATALGIGSPVNRTLSGIIRGIESSYKLRVNSI